MAADEILRTYGDTSVKEDVVLNVVTYITATENYFVKSLGRSKAINEIHSWLEDTYRTAATQSDTQGDDYTALAIAVPSRLTNLSEHITIPFKVGYQQQWVEHYTGQNELERQTTKALSEWGDAAEFDIVRSTLVSGASGTKAKMSGIIQMISKSTNYTSQNSGTVWAASILNGLMKAQWDNCSTQATDLFMGSFLRNATDAFTQKSNVVVANVGITEIVNTVEVFRTSHGNVRLHNHRWLQQSGDATARVLAVNPDTLKLAFLKLPYIDKTLARSGPYDFRAVAGDVTVEARFRDANWYADGFDKD